MVPAPGLQRHAGQPGKHGVTAPDTPDYASWPSAATGLNAAADDATGVERARFAREAIRALEVRAAVDAARLPHLDSLARRALEKLNYDFPVRWPACQKAR
jgi:hypothetical protein